MSKESGGKLNLGKLKQGTLNDVGDTSIEGSGDPRRTTVMQWLFRATSNTAQKSALEKIQQFDGIVVGSKEVPSIALGNKETWLKGYTKMSLFDKAGDVFKNMFSDGNEIAYYVFIPEIEPRPAPQGPDDPVIKTYQLVRHPEHDPDQLSYGQLVTVTFENFKTLHNPIIIKVGEVIDLDAEAAAEGAHGDGVPSVSPGRAASPPAPADFPRIAPEKILQEAKCYETANIPNKSQQTGVLNSLHPDFAPYVKVFICKCWEKGITIRLNSGYRSPAKQRRLYNAWLAGGKRGPAPSSGMSYHNFGMAFDFNPTLANGQVLTSRIGKRRWNESGVVGIGEAIGLYWGGHFRTNYDPIHWDARSTIMPRGNRSAFAQAADAAGNDRNRHPLV